MPVSELKFVAGDQLYVVAPLTVKVAVLPEQTVALFTVKVGVDVVLTLAVAVVVHELASLTVTV